MASSIEGVPVFQNRKTADGRNLIYKLTVLQQPQRARACGSGTKSANDRRPVDPPPVVELHIYEGATVETARDITFHYSSSFFMFVTLQRARPIAKSRGQTDPVLNQPPVLSGVPVSSMAYLDRPSEAGYFLFPDLSVRHEGTYRLTFQLCEMTKTAGDADAVIQPDIDFPDSTEFTDFRMEVQSDPFSVYSAKRFPGLTESTSLSRMVAEQGCRVRIRRDVRMRRRENKPSSSGFDEENRRGRSRTPEVQPDLRQRSSSASSDHQVAIKRRPSAAESFQPPPPPPYGPSTPRSHYGHDEPKYAHASQPPLPSPTTPGYSQGHPSPHPQYFAPPISPVKPEPDRKYSVGPPAASPIFHPMPQMSKPLEEGQVLPPIHSFLSDIAGVAPPHSRALPHRQANPVQLPSIVHIHPGPILAGPDEPAPQYATGSKRTREDSPSDLRALRDGERPDDTSSWRGNPATFYQYHNYVAPVRPYLEFDKADGTRLTFRENRFQH